MLWRQDNFAGGMVHRKSSGALQSNECLWLENFELNELAYAIARPGWTKLNTTALAGAVQGVKQYVTSTGTRLLVVVAGGTVYTYNEATGSFTSVGTGLNAASTTRCNFVVWDDDLVILNRVDAPQLFTSATSTVAALGGNPPVAGAGAQFYRHLFLTDIPGEPIRVYHSETDDITDGYAAKNYFFDVSVGDSSPNLALLSLDTNLLIGKRQSITAISGYDPRDFSQPQNRSAYTNERGVVGNMAFVEIAGVPWFISDDGVYSINGPFQTPRQSWALDGFTGDLDPTRLGLAFCVRRRDHDQGLFFLPRFNTSGSDLALVAHPGRGRGGLAGWTIWTGIEPTAACDGATDTGEVVFAGDADGYVWQMKSQATSFSDDIADIYYRLLTNDLDFGTPGSIHQLREIGLRLELDADVDLTVNLDTMSGKSAGYAVTKNGAVFYTGLDATGDALGAQRLDYTRILTSARDHAHRIEIVSNTGNGCRVAALEAKAYDYGRRQAPQ